MTSGADQSIPLTRRMGDEIFCRIGAREVRVDEFAADVCLVAQSLPAAQHLINMAVDRYRFTVLIFAAAVAGKDILLPGSRDASAIDRLVHDNPGSTIIHDGSGSLPGAAIRWEIAGNGRCAAPNLDGRAGITVFTSGSTGEARSHQKNWQLLDSFRHVHAGLLGLQRPHTLIATVPSWHMYGFEWALMLPTVAPVTLYCGNTFYPGDVIKLLDQHTPNSILVSTPVHLRALLSVRAASVQVATTLCATAPIDHYFAREIETHLTSQLLEIYGCSEIGSLAKRHTSTQEHWQFFDAFSLRLDGDELEVSHPLLSTPVVLNDVFSKQRDGYKLDGRATDIVKVGGKRESIARLNLLLQSIDGVDDGVFYRASDVGLPATDRLSAVAVSRTLSSQELRKRLARQVESAFLPRPLTLVDALPRNATGKLQQQDLYKLIRKYRDTP